MEKSIPKTLLVVKNRAMGDSVMTLSTLQFLKETFPETTLLYGVPSWIAPLYENCETAADKIIPLALNKLADWPSLLNRLKRENIDTILELFQSGRTSKFFRAWQAFGGPRYFAHNHHEKVGPVHDQGVIKSNIQRDLDAAWTFFSKKETVPNYIDYPPGLRPKDEIGFENDLIILGVVATRPTKMWPLSSYARLTHLLKDLGKKVIIPLGPDDDEIEAALKNEVSSNTQFLKAPLSELPHHLAKATLYIGNDTGLKHICVALDLPTFTLFGPEPPTEWHPYDPITHPYYFRDPLPCRTKVAHYCGLHTCDSMICLNEFGPEDLIKRIFSDNTSL